MVSEQAGLSVQAARLELLLVSFLALRSVETARSMALQTDGLQPTHLLTPG